MSMMTHAVELPVTICSAPTPVPAASSATSAPAEASVAPDPAPDVVSTVRIVGSQGRSLMLWNRMRAWSRSSSSAR
jgi:hypothetical protein